MLVEILNLNHLFFEKKKINNIRNLILLFIDCFKSIFSNIIYFLTKF